MTDTGTAPVRKRRVPFWDNARFICVTLVVIGHAIQRLTADSDPAYVAYLFIYSFHMPAFAIISGYFSKADPPNKRAMLRIITDILIPYLIMESVWSLVQFLVEGRSDFNPSTPSWTLWFLLALGIFRVILPYLALLRWPLTISVIASVGVGYFANVDSTFSLSRAIGILPFFVLGWRAREWGIADRWLRLERMLWMRVVAVAVLAAWVTVLIVYIDVWRQFELRFWFFYNDGYQKLGEDEWWAGLIRLAVILLAVVLCTAFLTLIPRRASWLTPLGQGTMYVYLLHSFLLYPLRESGLLTVGYPSGSLLVLMVLAGIAISIVLASPPVRRLFRPVIEPKPKWLFRAFDDAPTGHSRIDPTGSRRDRPAPRR